MLGLYLYSFAEEFCCGFAEEILKPRNQLKIT